MLASVTLFPALLGYLGRHVDRLRLPLGRGRRSSVAVGGHVEPSRGWLALEPLRRAAPRSSPRSSASRILLALAAPFLGVRFGFPDAGNNRDEHLDPAGVRHCSPTASAPASNGPLLLVAELPGRRRPAGAAAGAGRAAGRPPASPP